MSPLYKNAETAIIVLVLSAKLTFRVQVKIFTSTP